MKKYSVIVLTFLLCSIVYSGDIKKKNVYSTVSVYPISSIFRMPSLSYDITFGQKHSFTTSYLYSFRDKTPGHQATFAYSFLFPSQNVVSYSNSDKIGEKYHGVGFFLRASDREDIGHEYENDPYKYHTKASYLTPGFYYTRRYIYNSGFTFNLELGYGVPIEVFKGFRRKHNTTPTEKNTKITKRQSKILTGLEVGLKFGYSF